MTAVAEPTRLAAADMAVRCRSCYQCGRCRSACPQGLDLAGGPRAVVRLILAGEVEALLACEDVWRCSGCGACTEACPMGVDVAGMLAEVRRLQQDAGRGPRCPERSGAELSARRLRGHSSLNPLTLGLSMVARGFLPQHRSAAMSAGVRALRGEAAEAAEAVRPARRAAAPPEADGATVFFPGCALRLDRRAYGATHAVVAAAGVRLAEPDPRSTRCCGHPARDATVPPPSLDGTVLTACPACERTLAGAGTRVAPIWGAVVERARHGRCRLRARAARFVPYAGCLSDRDATLAMMVEAGNLAGAEPLMAQPSLHATCCGALGGVYRGPSQGVAELIRFAAAREAPIVTPCLLCRDNVGSAARQSHSGVEVHFWPEFFRAVPAADAAGAVGGAG
jgi:Fe-S oxidoreductase